MIDPPTKPPEDPERKVELDQTVDFAIQLLVEEARTIGWQRAEFLTAIMDSANARLSVLEEERQLDGDMAEEPANDWPAASEEYASRESHCFTKGRPSIRGTGTTFRTDHHRHGSGVRNPWPTCDEAERK